LMVVCGSVPIRTLTQFPKIHWFVINQHLSLIRRVLRCGSEEQQMDLEIYSTTTQSTPPFPTAMSVLTSLWCQWSPICRDYVSQRGSTRSRWDLFERPFVRELIVQEIHVLTQLSLLSNLLINHVDDRRLNEEEKNEEIHAIKMGAWKMLIVASVK
jgi:hypothetical protein